MLINLCVALSNSRQGDFFTAWVKIARFDLLAGKTFLHVNAAESLKRAYREIMEITEKIIGNL